MAHADPPDISLVEVIYGYFYFLCLNPCRTQQNHFPLSGYDEILSEPQKRRKWIHQRGAGEKCQFCLWRGHSRDEAFVGEGIFWNANPLESLRTRVYRATSRAPERELGTVSSTLHQSPPRDPSARTVSSFGKWAHRVKPQLLASLLTQTV